MMPANSPVLNEILEAIDAVKLHRKKVRALKAEASEILSYLETGENLKSIKKLVPAR